MRLVPVFNICFINIRFIMILEQFKRFPTFTTNFFNSVTVLIFSYRQRFSSQFLSSQLISQQSIFNFSSHLRIGFPSVHFPLSLSRCLWLRKARSLARNACLILWRNLLENVHLEERKGDVL